MFTRPSRPLRSVEAAADGDAAAAAADVAPRPVCIRLAAAAALPAASISMSDYGGTNLAESCLLLLLRPVSRK